MAEFGVVGERIVEALLASRPGLATSVGDHRYDDRLPDLSGDAIAADRAMLVDAASVLCEIDADSLDVEEQVDHALLAALVDRELFELTEIRAHEWNPLAYNPGPLLHALVSRPYAPVEVRLTALAGRLAAVPDTLASARATLRDMPRVHAETAVGQFTGVAALVRDEVSALLTQAPALVDRIEPAATAGVAALEEFVAWLRVGLAADAGAPERMAVVNTLLDAAPARLRERLLAEFVGLLQRPAW